MSVADATDALLPCPFCGGGAEYEAYPLRWGMHYVTCTNTNCHAAGPGADHKRDAIAAWNTRATEGAAHD